MEGIKLGSVSPQEEDFVKFTVYHVPKDTFLRFKEWIRDNANNRFSHGIKLLLDYADINKQFVLVHEKIIELERRVFELEKALENGTKSNFVTEDSRIPKTFGKRGD